MSFYVFIVTTPIFIINVVKGKLFRWILRVFFSYVKFLHVAACTFCIINQNAGYRIRFDHICKLLYLYNLFDIDTFGKDSWVWKKTTEPYARNKFCIFNSFKSLKIHLILISSIRVSFSSPYFNKIWLQFDQNANDNNNNNERRRKNTCKASTNTSNKNISCGWIILCFLWFLWSP